MCVGGEGGREEGVGGSDKYWRVYQLTGILQANWCRYMSGGGTEKRGVAVMVSPGVCMS